MTISRRAITRAIRRRAPWRHQANILLLTIPVIAVLGLAGIAYGSALRYEGRIEPGVFIGSVDVGGLTAADATVRITDGFANLGEGEITINAGAAHTEISYHDLRRGPDVGALVRAALAAHPANPLDALAEVVTGSHTILPVSVMLDQSTLAARVHAFAARVGAAATDASVTYGAKGFVVVPAEAGTGIDEAALVRSITSLLEDPATAPTMSVTASLAPSAPAVSDTAAASAAAVATRMTSDVTLTDGSDRWTIPAKTVARWITFGVGSDGHYDAQVSLPAVTATVQGLAKSIDQPPVNAGFLFSSSGSIVGTTSSRDGRALDVETTAADIDNAIAARAGDAAPAPVSAVVTPVSPNLTTAEAATEAPQMRMVSSWTTYYGVGEGNGYAANITLPAEFINGDIVAPGATFSFLQGVGPITAARGFRIGGAIVRGHTQEQGAIGGGICSASTTLFNAALRAGYEIDVRANHFYYISRYPVGLDATVWDTGGAVQDMVWRNDTVYPVLIRGIASPGVVTFQLWSVPTGRHVSLSTTTANHHSAADTIQRVNSLAAGVSERVEYATDGFDAWVTRTVTDGSGAVVHHETFASHYATVNGIVLVGVGPAAAPPPAPSRTPGRTLTPPASPRSSPTPTPVASTSAPSPTPATVPA